MSQPFSAPANNLPSRPVPLTRQRHGLKRWVRAADYQFASRSAVARLGLAEFEKACSEFPIVFARETPDAGFFPVAVQGFDALTNLLVSPDGVWRAGYIPAAFRGFPFSLIPQEGSKFSLGVFETTSTVFELDSAPPRALPFFDESGNSAVEVAEILKFLAGVQKSVTSAQLMSKLLADLNLLSPIAVDTVKRVGFALPEYFSRFHIVNEEALAELPEADFLRLFNSSFLPAVYAHLISLNQFSKLASFLSVKTPTTRDELIKGPQTVAQEKKGKASPSERTRKPSQHTRLEEIDFSVLLD